MTLRPKINLIMGALTLLFVIAMSWLQLHNMRDSVLEEMVAANRVAAQVLNRTVGRYASRGTAEILDFLQGMGRVRSNDITLLDLAGSELYRSPPSTCKAGRDAPNGL
jgi:two-component system sensor histidine kinase UhpB